MTKLETGVRILLISLLSVATIIGCAPAAEEPAPAEVVVTEPAIDLAAEKEAALQINRVWLEKTRARDAAGIGDLFVDEGWRLTSDDGLIEGRTAIVAALQKDMDENPQAVDDWGAKEAWVAASGDLAVERGWWKNDPDGDGEAAMIEGEYVTVLVKRDGAWKALTDVSTRLGGAGADG